jgi:hypothetical protein
VVPRTSPSGERSLARFLARRLKELRAERGLNLWDLAERSRGKIARSTLGNFESHVSFPSLPAVFAIAKALAVHPAQLLLDPTKNFRDAAASALLRADDATVAAIAVQLGVSAAAVEPAPTKRRSKAKG